MRLLPATVTLARPLLDCSRKQLEQIASERAIAHIVDESNEYSRYKRNAIRHHWHSATQHVQSWVFQELTFLS
jgi:tRNA(Ile)-lysidine synthase TilS/MesJ